MAAIGNRSMPVGAGKNGAGIQVHSWNQPSYDQAVTPMDHDDAILALVSYRDCRPHSASEAIRAPSPMPASLCQTTSDATYSLPAKVLKPQSVPAMMRSLSPTAATASRRRLATTCGCSTKFVVVSSTPGISSMCAGNGCSLSDSYSC